MKNIWFVYFDSPWFMRASYYYHGLGAGLFAYSRTSGYSKTGDSFRVDTTMSKNREKIIS